MEVEQVNAHRTQKEGEDDSLEKMMQAESSPTSAVL